MTDQAENGLCRLGKPDYDGLPQYIDALSKWFYPEHVRSYYRAVLPDGHNRLCLGVLVFGAYVDRFLRNGIPSLLAPGNLDALFDPLMIVHTDAANAERLATELDDKIGHCARVEVHVIPAEILAMVPENRTNVYWLLGAALNLHMQEAKYRAHSYHMLMPDHVYATGYFASMMRLAGDGKRAIVQGALSARLEQLEPILEQHNWAIRPDWLAGMQVEYMHPQMEPFVMNGRGKDDLPSSLLLVMVGQKAARIMSPHMTLVYISHDLLMRAPVRLFNTTDAQLPFFIPDDVEAYVPGADDGMVYCELSDTEKETPWQPRCTEVEFCARFWITTHCTRGFERYFGLTTVLPFPDNYVPPVKPMYDQQIDEFEASVRALVADSHDSIYAALPEQHRTDPMAWREAV